MRLNLAKDPELIPNQSSNQVLSHLDVSEKGSVDAGLTLIPTTIFFLVLLQVILAGSWQVMERAKLHDLLIRDSITASAPTTAGSSLNKPSESGSLDSNQNVGNKTLFKSKRSSEYGDIYEYVSEKRVPVFGALLENLGVNDFKIKLSAIRVE
jgi:hypothetical protein